MAGETIYTLPRNTTFKYLNEGAANIVYRIELPPGTPQASILEEYEEGEPVPGDLEITPPDPLANKLLRLRKDLPTTISTRTAQQNWRTLVTPLFEDDEIVQQSLVALLRGRGKIEKFNEDLRSWELHGCFDGFHEFGDDRPKKRRGVYLADDAYGLLVTDMTKQGPNEETFEFKPKWLVQSPSAPFNAKRCRQCAHVARSNAENARKEEPLQEPFCPFNFISSDYQKLFLAAKFILKSKDGSPRPQRDTLDRIADWLKNNVLLRKLAKHQAEFDTKGPLGEETNEKAFRTAMTLRDCTVFLRITDILGRSTIEARLGDLDLKSKGKEEYWRKTEHELIEDGWYTATEDMADRQPNVCLWPQSAGRISSLFST